MVLIQIFVTLLLLSSDNVSAEVSRISCEGKLETFFLQKTASGSFHVDYSKNNSAIDLGDDLDCIFADPQNLLFSCSVGGSKIWSLIHYTEPKSLEIQILGFTKSEVLTFQNLANCHF